MKRFDIIKTIQLILLAVLTVTALVLIFSDRELYQMIAADPHIRALSIILWVVLGLSFIFLLYDFNSYSGLRRENMELDHAVYSDALTGIANRYSADVFLAQYLNQELPKDMGCVTVDFVNLSEINSISGHEGGDAAIQAFSAILLAAAQGAAFIGRNGGDKFLVIFRDCTDRKLEKFTADVEAAVAKRNESGLHVPIRFAAGTAFDEGENVKSLTALVALSDRRATASRQEES